MTIVPSPCILSLTTLPSPSTISPSVREDEKVVSCLSATETVESAALTLERVNDVEGCDSLALGVLGVRDGVSNDTLQEGLEDASGFLVDHWQMGISKPIDQDMFREAWKGKRYKREGSLLAEIRLTPPRRARRRMAGLVIPWMLSRRIFRWRLAPPLPRPFPPLPPVK